MNDAPAPRVHGSVRVVLVLMAIVYLAAAAWLVFGPSPDGSTQAVGDGVAFTEDRLVRDDSWMHDAIDRVSTRVTVEEFSNLLLFLPVPILALLVSRRWWWVSVPVGVAASIGIEALQRRYLGHRTPTWNDVLWNTAGLLVGAGLVLAASIAGRIARRLRDRTT